jgi:hypothetical protein
MKMNNPNKVTKVKESCPSRASGSNDHFYMVHRKDAKRAERKFLYKNLCGLCVSAVSYRFRHFLLDIILGTFNPRFEVLKTRLTTKRVRNANKE